MSQDGISDYIDRRNGVEYNRKIVRRRSLILVIVQFFKVDCSCLHISEAFRFVQEIVLSVGTEGSHPPKN